MTRAALYTRVSTQEQAEEGFSLAAQLERLRAYCQSQGWDVAEVYTDEGVSAKTADRPELKRLLDDTARGVFDLVLVYKLDRLTRSVVDLYELLQVLDRHQVGFKSATEVFDTTTAMGRLFITIVAALAQWERENLAERVYFGMRQKALEGKRVSNRVPYGYRVAGGKMVIRPEQASVVRRVFDRYLAGAGAYTIARELQREGVTPPQGPRWRTNAVLYMLHNPVYIGTVRWGYRASGGARKSGKEVMVPGEHEPILDAGTFARAQDILSRRRTIAPRAGTGKYPFTGVLYCSCGAHMTGITFSSGRVYYRCLDRSTCSTRMSVRQDDLEAALLARLAELTQAIPAPDVVRPRKKPRRPDPEKKRAEIEERQKRLWDAYESGEMTLVNLKERLTRLRTEAAQIDQAAGEEDEYRHEERQARRRQMLQEISRHWNAATPQERKEMLRSVVDRMDVESADRVVVTLKSV